MLTASLVPTVFPRHLRKRTGHLRRGGRKYGGNKICGLCGQLHPWKQQGIQVYDVNVEEGKLVERSEVKGEQCILHRSEQKGKYLYSIEDEGVAVFSRDENGDLTHMNSVDIDGMRGCFLATDVDGKYLYVAGYHDGR